ncbi:DNA-directed DNA polymerase [Parasponia andersonii]|uniref:DNA-directed DNA polymerase n=1 Tax=Parasponia andersonii TaxID=3476 RepID=A0A2P5DXG7_PARAD|nr:DNA-directed DNA polymerase [Parasponia andersonii]
MNESTTTHNGRWVCMDRKEAIRSRGVFFGNSPFKYATSILYVQLSISALLTSFLQWILNPLGQSAFISQMLAGIVLGPSVIGFDNVFVKTVFPRTSFYVSGTFAFFGCMLFMFLVGVKIDLGSITNSGKRALAIGLCCFFIPLLLNTSLALILQRTVKMEPVLHKSIISIAVFQSSSSFYVTACLLTDLKLLNSELGRLAVSSSMISGMLSWIVLVLGFMVRQSTLGVGFTLPFMAISLCFMLVVIVFILRPVMRSMVRHANRGRAVKESYIFSVFVMVLCCAFLGEFIGQHFMLGPMILGLAVPDGPPLGTALVDKLDSYVSLILLPSYFVFSGASINLPSIQMKTFGIVWLLVLSSFFAKLIGAVVPSLLCKMPVVDALALGLVLSAQGITDILIWQHGMMLLLIDQQSYSIMVIATMVLTGTITPIVRLLYDPSKRYVSTKKRNIEHASEHDSELRLLACIHRQDNTPSIIRLLEVSNATMKNPICFYVVHLIRLAGRSTPLLITHRPGERNSSHSNQSNYIINAFQLFEQQNYGKVMMTAITAMAPCASMHDDICSLALEKRVCMVIVPFHKNWSHHGADDALTSNPLRTVNLNILKNAPCSVGILVDRGAFSSTISLSSKTPYSVGMFFVEGPDDREALAYAIRMAEQPNVSITLVRLRDSSEESQGSNSGDDKNKQLDSDMIGKFKSVAKEAGKKRHHFKDKRVKNSVEVISAVRSMANSCDLILVGRRHSSESSLFVGLTEWNEYPELGFIGDVLASADIKYGVSLLVVQQQSFEGQNNEPYSPRYFIMNNASAGSVHVDIHRVHDYKGKVKLDSKETNRKSIGV